MPCGQVSRLAAVEKFHAPGVLFQGFMPYGQVSRLAAVEKFHAPGNEPLECSELEPSA